MTKDQELAILDKAIAALGADTYCGPWLVKVRWQVERDIRSDIFPDFSIVACQRECAELKKQTEAACMSMRAGATAYATQVRAEAVRRADEIASIHAAGIKEQLRQVKWVLDKVIANLP